MIMSLWDLQVQCIYFKVVVIFNNEHEPHHNYVQHPTPSAEVGRLKQLRLFHFCYFLTILHLVIENAWRRIFHMFDFIKFYQFHQCPGWNAVFQQDQTVCFVLFCLFVLFVKQRCFTCLQNKRFIWPPLNPVCSMFFLNTCTLKLTRMT